jgi:hypothetical protein
MDVPVFAPCGDEADDIAGRARARPIARNAVARHVLLFVA